MTVVTSFQELLDRYAAGERDFRSSELDSAPFGVLVRQNLSNLDLSYSFVIADFTGADLSGAKFMNANVKTCDFSEANLRGANFSGAALDGTCFAGSVLEGATFEGASVQARILRCGEQPDW